MKTIKRTKIWICSKLESFLYKLKYKIEDKIDELERMGRIERQLSPERCYCNYLTPKLTEEFKRQFHNILIESAERICAGDDNIQDVQKFVQTQFESSLARWKERDMEENKS